MTGPMLNFKSFRPASNVLAAIELMHMMSKHQFMIERGNTMCRLESTETAHRFYRARGYSETGPAGHKFGTRSGYPMSKTLA